MVLLTLVFVAGAGEDRIAQVVGAFAGAAPNAATTLAGVTNAISAVAATPEAQMPGSEAPKAVAEARHIPKVHGIDFTARQPVAQAAGSASAQAKAEAIHLAKDHGTVNNAADRYTLQAASKL